MTSIFSDFMTAILSLFRLPINLYGFTFSLWDVFIFTLFVGLVLRFVGGLLDL